MILKLKILNLVFQRQGSILGPLSFSVFINDIMDLDSNINLYVDDIGVIINKVTLDTLYDKGNYILAKINAW